MFDERIIKFCKRRGSKVLCCLHAGGVLTVVHDTCLTRVWTVVHTDEILSACSVRGVTRWVARPSRASVRGACTRVIVVIREILTYRLTHMCV